MKAKFLLASAAVVVASGCGGSSTVEATDENAAGTPLELLSNAKGFELESATGSLAPVLSGHTSADRIRVMPSNQEANAPTVEYRFACSDLHFAQIFIYSPSETSRYRHWDTDPSLWTNGTDVYGADVAYGAPHRDGEEGLYSLEYLFIEEPWIHVGGAMGKEVVVPTVSGQTYVVVSSADNIRYEDPPVPDSPQQAAVMDPYQAPIDCVAKAWDAATPFFDK